MKHSSGQVMYVGKAKSLKKRVTSYTNLTRQSNRLRRMIMETASMEFVTTHTEAEALLLEAQLIKRWRPPYNVLLRDDKSFPFIFLREDHAFPRISKHRGARSGKGVFYGPFASAGAVNATLNALQKVFLLRSCTDSFYANRSRPCLLHQIRRCSVGFGVYTNGFLWIRAADLNGPTAFRPNIRQAQCECRKWVRRKKRSRKATAVERGDQLQI